MNSMATPGQRRILIVDDEEAIRKLSADILGAAGFCVNTASDGSEGFQFLLHEDVDVVVADYHMRPMDGLVFVQEVRRMWPRIGIVVFSAYLSRELISALHGLGVSRILEKPLSSAQIIEAVSNECRDAAANAPAFRSSSSAGGGLALEVLSRRIRRFRRQSEAALSLPSLRVFLEHFVPAVSELFTCEALGILEIADDEQSFCLLPRRRLAEGQVELFRSLVFRRQSEMAHVSTHVFDTVEMNVLPPVHDTPAPEFEEKDLVMVPLVSAGDVHGILMLLAPEPAEIRETAFSFLYDAVNHFVSVMRIQRQSQQLSIRDGLTGLSNRRHFDEELKHAWGQARRYGEPLSLLMVDLDHFKKINDTRGHAVGDRVLVSLARLLTARTRPSDIVARYGGDEFVIVIPQTDAEAATAFAQSLLAAMQGVTAGPLHPDLHPVVSIGVATWLPQLESVSAMDLLNRADQALYQAKRAGRGRFCTWRPSQAAGMDTVTSLSAPVGAAVPPPPLPLDMPILPGAGGRVMVVDDDESVNAVLVGVLKAEGYNVVSALNATTALEMIQRGNPGELDVLLSDFSMPGMNGFEMLRRVQMMDDTIVKIVLTGAVTAERAIEAMRNGVYELVEKPVSRSGLRATMARAFAYRRVIRENLEYRSGLEDLVSAKSGELMATMNELRSSLQFTLDAMVGMLATRERDTGEHSVRVRELALILARNAGVTSPELDDIGYGAFLHDIGKIGIPDNILLKPGKLTPDELKIMRTHPQVGYQLLEYSPFLRSPARIVLEHHEKYDGSGYPNGLKGEAICLGARIFAVVDSYDAIRSKRVYRSAREAKVAMEEIVAGAGYQFDPEVVRVFVTCHEEIEKEGRWPASVPQI